MSEHYFSGSPGAASAPQQITVALSNGSLRLKTDVGVFSKDRLDPGTEVLLALSPLPDTDGDLLDVGCGYGPITFALATQRPDSLVWAVDVNTRALELVRENAEQLGVRNVRACLPEEVPPETRFRGIYSNPPIRIGKSALHDLLTGWLGKLADDGTGYLVVQRNLGSDSLAKWLETQGFPTEKLGSRRGYRVLEVRRETS